MSRYREHGSGYLAPRIRPAAETAAGTLILAVTLSWLGPAFLDAEDAMPSNAPTTEIQLLTADDLAAYRAAHEPRCCTQDHTCNQGRDCPMRMPAEAATDIGAEPRGKHREGWLSGVWLRLRRALT